MPRLLLGPIQRAVSDDHVTVWVETDAPCEVEIAGATARTVTLLGHHYALVAVACPASPTPYAVALDGEAVWPPADDRLPPSVLRPPPTDGASVAFGSCRSPLHEDASSERIDALREYAWRAAAGGSEALPDALVLLGDQVYADKPAPATRRFIARRRDTSGPVGHMAHAFPEFVALYREAWGDPAVAWLLSAVPTLMMFDDHDLIDNWNTSARWVAERQATSWWTDHVTNGLAAYWIYQHLGNLSPAERSADPAFAALQRGDESVALSAFARRATDGLHGTPGVAWSYARDLGPAHVAMVDVRDARALDGGRRHLLDDDEWAWLAREAEHPAPYLLIGTSLPMLLPPGAHELERLATVACAGRWGRVVARVAEHARRAGQLNHWAAFPPSFTRAVGLLRATAGAPTRAAVVVLSGDVHYAYAATVRRWADGSRPGVPIVQLVSSPLCYDLYRSIAGGFRALVSRPGNVLGRGLARLAGAPRPPGAWSVDTGPWLANVIATLTLTPAGASYRFERARAEGEPGRRLEPVAEAVMGASNVHAPEATR